MRPFGQASRNDESQIRQSSAQAARGIRRGGHGRGAAASRRIGRNLDRCWIRQANTGVPLHMVFPAGGAIALSRIFIAQAGQLITTTDTIAITGLRSRFDRNQSHWHHRLSEAMLPKIFGADKGPHRPIAPDDLYRNELRLWMNLFLPSLEGAVPKKDGGRGIVAVRRYKFLRCARRNGEPRFSRSSIQCCSGMDKKTLTTAGSN